MSTGPVSLRAGTDLPTRTYRVTRLDLVRYAGASGDFNAIHWSDRAATGVGLPGVIAHGMYTMGLAARAVTSWTGDPGGVLEYGVRFTRPVPVPDTDDGTEVVVAGTVKPAERDGCVLLSLTVTCHGDRVLAQARAVVRAG